MIIYFIDDVYDLEVGHVCRDYKSNNTVGNITFVSSKKHDPGIVYPTVCVDGEFYFRNGFEFYDSHKINEYMIKPNIAPWWPRIKL